ncbi:hypothetical protein KFK09_027269 [Dendrobium nobile]|uniref:Uncharacterized protein n=1 Tax=Dendrobium nobile TaxID=94219 RepID=A0A8T3AA92_DENNO|nr:hypothetical protein KFK09_027269 [Dendrobium nobile]
MIEATVDPDQKRSDGQGLIPPFGTSGSDAAGRIILLTGSKESNWIKSGCPRVVLLKTSSSEDHRNKSWGSLDGASSLSARDLAGGS